MGVYIPKMSKPNYCYECDLIGSDICTPVKDTEKPINCPLVEVKEPHGRLIDADFEEAHYTSMTTKPTPDVSQKDKENSLIIVKALQMARTVIESEGE